MDRLYPMLETACARGGGHRQAGRSNTMGLTTIGHRRAMTMGGYPQRILIPSILHLP